MKKRSGFLMIFMLGFLVSACATDSTAVNTEKSTACPAERPMMCTMDYTPVCGLRGDTQTKTYSNGCTACADPEVISYLPGACPEKVLSAAEMTELFSGNTYEASIPSRKLTMTVYVDPDGTLRGMQGGHKFTSKWTINEQGAMCVSYRNKKNCRQVVLQDGVYKKFTLDEQGRKKVLVIYDSFAKGNINHY